MTRKRAAKPPTAAPVAAPTAIPPPDATPVQRTATPEEQAQIQAQMQRQRAADAVLKQNFAETHVAMTIAQAERDQLIRQNQLLQQENVALKAEIVELKKPKRQKKTPTNPDDAHVPQHQ